MARYIGSTVSTATSKSKAYAIGVMDKGLVTLFVSRLSPEIEVTPDPARAILWDNVDMVPMHRVSAPFAVLVEVSTVRTLEVRRIENEQEGA